MVRRGAKARRRDRRGQQADRVHAPASPLDAAAHHPRDHRPRGIALDRFPCARHLGTRGQILFAFGIAIGFALLLFKVSPALITNWLPIESTGAFVVIEGLVRVTIFILYLLIISLLPDLKRVFQYHAAEHKAINAYEAGEELVPEKVQRFSLIHPRCGTAFLLWVMVIAIFVFAFFGRPEWYWLIASRILLLPVIAGIAYELIRFAGNHTDNRILMTLLAPGLWLQRLTTREPSLDQIEVSIRALREVLRLEGRLSPEERRVEVMA
jgi:uncharacterized protein YqhQ